jgi:hypothetical protein
MKNKKFDPRVGDIVKVIETYSSYGANEDVTKYICTVEQVDDKLRLMHNGKPFYRGANSYYEFEVIGTVEKNPELLTNPQP